MPLARYQFTVTDEAGNVVPSAFVRVRREQAGMSLAPLFSDRSGLVAKANPFQADSEGFAFFHVQGGAYQVEAFKGAFSRTWRYVGIGLASETDLNVLRPRGDWASDFTYDVGDFVHHEGFIFASLADTNIGNEPSVVGSPPEAVTDAFWMVIPSVQGADGAGDLYDYSVYVLSKPLPGEMIGRHEFTSHVDFLAGLALSKASAEVAATADTVFSITKNGVEFGTVTFPAASAEGVFDSAADEEFVAGDLLRIIAPTPRDDTLSFVSITLLGNRAVS